jgi:hypothetical protein
MTSEATKASPAAMASIWIIAAKTPWVPLLIEAAGAAVGLGNAQYGAAEVFVNADDLLGLTRLARELVLTADRFSALSPKPPPLEEIDESFSIGTDVAHVIVGSFGAVEAIEAVEDPDDWPATMKKHKCVGLQTGGDGEYQVRVIGANANGRARAFPWVVCPSRPRQRRCCHSHRH